MQESKYQVANIYISYNEQIINKAICREFNVDYLIYISYNEQIINYTRHNFLHNH